MGESAAWTMVRSKALQENLRSRKNSSRRRSAGGGGGSGEWGQERVSGRGSHTLAHRAAQELRGHDDWTAGNMGEWSGETEEREGADSAGFEGHDKDLFLTIKATGSHQSFPLSLKSLLRQPIAESKRIPLCHPLSQVLCLPTPWSLRRNTAWKPLVSGHMPNRARGPGNPLLRLVEHMAAGSSPTSLQASPPQRLLKAVPPGPRAGGWRVPSSVPGKPGQEGLLHSCSARPGQRRGCNPWRGVTRLLSQPARRIHTQTLSSRKHRMFQQVL